MSKTIYPVIMCGGAGTRLWPLSNRNKAKQYHALVTDKTMLQETVIRMAGVTGLKVGDPSFVCAANDETYIREQCAQINSDILHIVLEPMGRNTAPLAAIISEIMHEIDPDGLILLLPADHHIDQPVQFWEWVGKGVKAASNGKLVTLGIQPDRPETGFGYIKRGQNIGADVFDVGAFVEKPDAKTAQIYVESKEYFWNAGIFLFSPTTMLESFKTHSPEILAACSETLDNTQTDQSSIFLDQDTFAKCPADSLDYAVMEKAGNVAVVAPVDIGWNDLGSWLELARLSEKMTSSETNKGNVIALDCENTFVRTDGPLVTAIGLDNLIVVVEDGKILIVPRDRTQDVKKIVEHLKSEGRDDLC